MEWLVSTSEKTSDGSKDRKEVLRKLQIRSNLFLLVKIKLCIVYLP